MAYHKIKEMMFNYDIVPGQRLIFVDFAERLGVSRTPINNALSILANEGFLDFIPDQGYRVHEITQEEASHLYEIREREEIQNLGWQVSASYFLTGEANSFKPVTPKRPVTLGSGGGWGARELTARVEGLDVDNDAFPIFADPASSATAAFSWGAGFNWHLNLNVKLQFNYERTDFKGASANPVTSQDENVFLSRVQITF